MQAVTTAYYEAGRSYGSNVNAHEVRAIATSWAYSNQVALTDVMAAAFWRSSGVFQNSYYRDLAACSEGIYTFGPIVVAQHVIHPPTAR